MLEKLSTETTETIFETLPLDVTFIDEKDIIRYYNKGADAIFKRSPKNIGMKVQDCHSPKSRPMVDKIISDLKAGRSNVAESWIDQNGRKIHIRYFAVRDKACRYIGVLEVVQDITDIQKITGEKRTVD
ncbi:MAG: DUF438 domain-containing protein [Chloroflexi bacterium]|nr:DUF438 domain-containing protein [Chloroflexota bacterium]